MKPAAFTYLQPDTVEEAIDALQQHGDEARVLAGGQSLMAMLNLRLTTPAVLIDISRLEPLRSIHLEGGVIEIGAAVTQAELESWPDLAEQAPLIAKAIPWVGHFQTRNRGTVCGSIAHADPSSELPLCLALMEGEVVLRSAQGERRVSAEAFQRGLLQTDRREDELITAVRLPAGVGQAGTAFREIARRHGDFAIVALGVIAGQEGRMQIGIGGVADRPHVEPVPASLSEAEYAEFANALAWRLGGYDDIHASARYRRDLVRRIAPQLITEVQECGE